MSRQRAPQPKTLHPGDEAPNFSLVDQKGERHSLFEYRSEYVLVYFFGKADIAASTEENAPVPSDFKKIKARRVYVLGVSPASSDDHLEFARRFGITVRLLSDPDKKVMKLYGVIPSGRGPGRIALPPIRTSYLVSPQGKIERIYEAKDDRSRGDEILKDLKDIPGTENRRTAPADMKIPGMAERRFRID
jgi:thioredoxin-dependent peroxiredoxin